MILWRRPGKKVVLGIAGVWKLILYRIFEDKRNGRNVLRAEERRRGFGGKIGGNGGRWLVLAKGSSTSSVTINQRNAFAELHPRNFCRIHPIEITTLPDCPIFIVFKVPTSPLRSDRPSYKLFILASCHATI